MKISSPSQELPSVTFFGDSSSRDRRYMVAGGFLINAKRMLEIEAEIARLREQGGIGSEFHWSAYRGGERRAAYEALVDYAFDLVRTKRAHMHVIIAKFEGYNHKAKVGENKDTSINRMYFQLCLHRLARFYGKTAAIHVRLDAGNDSRDICGMRIEACAAAYKQLGTKPNCIRSIEPISSHKVGLVQMADVIVGAIAAKQNDVKHRSPKGDLADYVLKASGRHTWGASTPASERFLTVWHFTAKDRVPRSPISGGARLG